MTDRPLVNATQRSVDWVRSATGLSKFRIQQLAALSSAVFALWGVFSPPIMSSFGGFVVLVCVFFMVSAIGHAAYEEHNFLAKNYVKDTFWQDNETRLDGVIALIITAIFVLLFMDEARRPFVYACACFIVYIYVSASVPRRRTEDREASHQLR